MLGGQNDANALTLAIETMGSNPDLSINEIFNRLNNAFDKKIGSGKSAVDKNGRTPLMLAIINQNLHAVDWFFRLFSHTGSSPDVDHIDHEGYTALMYAVRFTDSNPNGSGLKQGEILDYLLDNKIIRLNPWLETKQERLAAAEAAAHGNIYFLNRFFNQIWPTGGYFQKRNFHYYLVLEHAALQCQSEVIKYLFYKCNWPDEIKSDKYWRNKNYSIISYILDQCSQNKIGEKKVVRLIKLFQTLGFPIYFSIIPESIKKGHMPLIVYLDKKFDLNDTQYIRKNDFFHLSVIGYAAHAGHAHLVEFLSKHKNLLQYESENCPLLANNERYWKQIDDYALYAAVYGHFEVVKTLLKHKAYNLSSIKPIAEKTEESGFKNIAIFLKVFFAIKNREIQTLNTLKNDFERINPNDKRNLKDLLKSDEYKFSIPIFGEWDHDMTCEHTGSIDALNTENKLLLELPSAPEVPIAINQLEQKELESKSQAEIPKSRNPSPRFAPSLQQEQKNDDFIEIKEPDSPLPANGEQVILYKTSKPVSPMKKSRISNDKSASEIEDNTSQQINIDKIKLEQAEEGTQSKITTPGNSPIHHFSVFNNKSPIDKNAQLSFHESCLYLLKQTMSVSLHPGAAKPARDAILLSMVLHIGKDEKAPYQVTNILSQAFDEALKQNDSANIKLKMNH